MINENFNPIAEKITNPKMQNGTRNSFQKMSFSKNLKLANVYALSITRNMTNFSKLFQQSYRKSFTLKFATKLHKKEMFLIKTNRIFENYL